jgi:hypothetical protein
MAQLALESAVQRFLLRERKLIDVCEANFEVLAIFHMLSRFGAAKIAHFSATSKLERSLPFSPRLLHLPDERRDESSWKESLSLHQ